ncbi:hypothetical protein SteCoe_11806 [Stentor coeruleus]|uniref:TmcB/TmcC TPR repeats domain-containing protein n=1 Tax=Stentor coeruleus TaxID=5963 RepID=A0A1R2CCA9_9CILI|nr:hypothetical protein SteCoe_11806 [Stentor coeruleus]
MNGSENSTTKELQKIAQGTSKNTSTFFIIKLQENTKKIMFKMMLKLFPLSYESSGSPRTQVVMLCISVIIQTLHLLSLLWFPIEDLKYWEKFKIFWTILGYSRFDNICSTLNILPTCFYLSLSLISFQTICIAIFIIFYIEQNKDSAFLQGIIRKLYSLMSTYLYIPILCITTLYTKYSISSSDTIAEYNIKYTDLEISAFSPAIAVCALIHFLNDYFYSVLHYENRHSFAKYNLESKPHSRIDKLKVLITTILVVFYVILANSYREVYRAIYAIGCFILALAYFKYQPYFSSYANLLHIGSYTFVCCTALIFEFSYLTNNSVYLFIISIFVTPMIVGIIIYKSSEYFSHKVLILNEANSLYEFEKALRPLFFAKDHEENYENIITTFSDAYKDKHFGKSPFMVIWLTNYCFYTLEDDSLTRIKIGTETDLESTLDSDFQLFRLRETIKKGGLEYREDIDYLNFRFKLEKVKLDDEHLCISLLEFLRQMSSETNFKYLLSKLIPSISHLLSHVSNQYQALILKYPKSTAILELYASFLKNIINHYDKAAELKRKKENLLYSNKQGHLKTISYFDEENALIIISGARESFAIITFANEKVGKILRQPVNTIIGNSISSYVPYPFSIGHNQHMQKFLITCSNSDIKLPLGLFLQTQIGYLVECYIQIRCTALDASPFFIVLMKERRTKREIGILSSAGVILNHSERFPSLLGENALSLKDKNLDDYLEGISYHNLQENYPIIIQREFTQFAVIRSFKIIKKKKVNVVYILTDEKEIAAWFKGKYLNEIEYNYKQRIDMTSTLDEQKSDRNPDEEIEENNEKFEKIFTTMKEDSTLALKSENVQAESDTILVREKTIAISSKNYNGSSGQNSLSSNPRFTIVFKFLSRFRYISCALFFVVLSLQIAIIVVINMKYTIENPDEMINVAETSALLSKIALLARGLYLNSDNPMPDINSYNDFQIAYKNLTDEKSLIKNIVHDSSCDLKIVFPIDKYIEINTLSMISSKKPALDIIQDILVSMQNYINSKNSQSLLFIILNSILSAENLFISYHELDSCKKTSANNQYNIMQYFILASLFLSGISVIFIIYSMMKINKHYTIIWRTFCNLASSRTDELRRRIIKRLTEIHKKIEYNSHNDFEKSSSKVNVKIGMFMYIWRFVAYAIFLAGFYSFLYLYTISKLESIISVEPLALKSVYDQKKLAIDLNFWIRESVLQNNVTSFDMIFPKIVLLKPPELYIESIRERLKISQNYYGDRKLNDLITKTTEEALFNENYGILGGVYEMINEIVLLSYDVSRDNLFVSLDAFQEKFYLFQEIITSFSKLVETDLNNEEREVKKVSLIFTIFYSLFSFALFTIIFNFMLHENEEKIKDIQLLGEFIPAKTI